MGITITTKNKNFAKRIGVIKLDLDAALAKTLTDAQAYLVSASPKDTGRFASSWLIGKNKPKTFARGENWAPPGAKKTKLRPYRGKITFGGAWFISNYVPYAVYPSLFPQYAKNGAGGPAWFTSYYPQIPNIFSRNLQFLLRQRR